MKDVVGLFGRAVDEFDRRVAAVTDDQWTASTPCTDWDVRTLVNHLVYENRWVKPLLEGRTIAEVGDAFDGDLLGDDPKGAWRACVDEASTALAQPGLENITVHVSFGDISGHYYVSQLITDHVIHSWDLARGIGASTVLDPELVAYTYEFIEPQAEQWRAAGAFGDVVDVPDGADKQTKLLALTGRRA